MERHPIESKKHSLKPRPIGWINLVFRTWETDAAA
jgi:hypothetical protein